MTPPGLASIVLVSASENKFLAFQPDKVTCHPRESGDPVRLVLVFLISQLRGNKLGFPLARE